MNINEAFPGKYIKSVDLKGREVTVVVASVEMETINAAGERFPVMHFQGKERGMIIKKTNANRLEHMFGPDTENWIGKEITIRAEPVEFQGKIVDGIRVKIIKPQTIVKREKYELSSGNGNRAPADDDLEDFR
jgi:hypothetical protein